MVETDKSTYEERPFFQPMLPQPSSWQILEASSERNIVMESRGRIRMNCPFPKNLACLGKVPSVGFGMKSR